jgi:hypothetical protein
MQEQKTALRLFNYPKTEKRHLVRVKIWNRLFDVVSLHPENKKVPRPLPNPPRKGREQKTGALRKLTRNRLTSNRENSERSENPAFFTLPFGEGRGEASKKRACGAFRITY